MNMVSAAVKALYTTIYSQAHSQQNELLVAGSNDGNLLIYDVEALLQREEGGGARGADRPLGPVASISASPHPIYCLQHTEHFAVAGSTGTIKGWRWTDLKNSDKTAPDWSITLDSDQANFGTPEVNSLAHDKDDGTLWAACGDWKTRGYDMETGKLVTTLEGHKDYVHQVAVSGTTVITAGEDGAVLVWDSRTPRASTTSIVPSDSPRLARPKLGKYISSMDYSGEWLVCGGGPRAAIYHLRSAGITATLPPAEHPVTVTNLTRTEEGVSVVTAGSDGGFVSVCNLSGQVTAKLPTSARCIYTVVVSADKHTLMSIGGYGSKIDMCLNLSYRDHTVTTVID